MRRFSKFQLAHDTAFYGVVESNFEICAAKAQAPAVFFVPALRLFPFSDAGARGRGTGTGQSRPSRIGPGLFRRAELRAQGAHLPPCHECDLLFGIRPVSLRWFFEDPCHALSPGSARKKSAALRADAVLGRDPILLRFVFAPTPTASWQTADGFPHVFRDCADPRCIAARSGSQRACASFLSPSSHS